MSTLTLVPLTHYNDILALPPVFIQKLLRHRVFFYGGMLTLFLMEIMEAQ